MKFSADGNFIVSNSLEKSGSMSMLTSGTMAPRPLPPEYIIPLWDVKMHKQVIGRWGFFHSHDYCIDSCFSPDGRQIASNHWKVIKIWDVSTGVEIMTIHD